MLEKFSTIIATEFFLRPFLSLFFFCCCYSVTKLYPTLCDPWTSAHQDSLSLFCVNLYIPFLVLVTDSCHYSAGVLWDLLHLKMYSWCICGERCTPHPPSPLLLLRDIIQECCRTRLRNWAIGRKMSIPKDAYILSPVLFQGIWVSTYIFTICFAANVGLLFGVVCTTAIVIGRFPR